jgi:hypothetical protein
VPLFCRRPDDFFIRFRFVPAPAAGFTGCVRETREIFLLARVLRARGFVGIAISAASRTFAVTFSARGAMFSLRSWVTLVNVPAACPSLRATAFRRGSCFGIRFRVVIALAPVPGCAGWTRSHARQNEVPALKGRDFHNISDLLGRNDELGSAALTVAVLIIFLVFALPLAALLGLVLVGLAALLALTGLVALLALSRLAALLTLFLHIVCHKSPPEKAWAVPRLRNLLAILKLVAVRDCKGWEESLGYFKSELDGPPPCEMFPFRKMEGATAQLNAQRWSQDDHNSDANAGMKQIEQKIFAVYVVDVALIRVSPPRRPRVYDVEPVAAILEAPLAFDNSGLMDNKSVLAPEIGAELVIRNAAAFLRVLS